MSGIDNQVIFLLLCNNSVVSFALLFLLELYHTHGNTVTPGGANREHFKNLQMEQVTAYLSERLDQALRRDSRRYDGPFSLY